MNLAARVTLIEAAVAKLATSRGPRVSDLMRAARQRSIAGEATPLVLRDVEELERQASGRGLAAEMAKAALRVLRGPPDALLPPGVEAQNSRGAVGSTGGEHRPASRRAPRARETP